MTLADFSSANLIVPRLSGSDTTAIISELSRVLYRENRVPDASAVCQIALAREKVVSTNMDGCIALPHGRLATLEEVSFALGRTDAPVAWGTNAAPSVRLVFLLAVPANDSLQYLALISGLARLSKEKALVEKLLNVPDANGIFEVLQQIEVRGKPKPKAALSAW